MRFVAYLQRFDDAHVEIASSTERAEVVDAAIQIYSSLISEILAAGREMIRNQAEEERHLGGGERYWQDTQSRLALHGISSKLRAQEWNISVYDREWEDPANGIPSTQMIFSIGATLEDPRP